MLVGMRRFLLGLPTLLLASCGVIPDRPTTPVRTLVSDPAAEPDELVVLLPGRWSEPEEFSQEGFTALVRERHPDARIVAPDLHLGYYQSRIAARRLEEDVIAPARRDGVDRVIVVGISMGGLGALIHSVEFPGSADELILLSPFAGEPEVIDEIAAAGGMRNWSPPPELEEDDFSRRLWMALKRSEQLPVIRLACGESDRLASTSRRIEEDLLKPGECLWLPGDHDWPTWNALYRRLP